MPSKTKKESSGGWKEAAQGFVANVLEKVSDNISEKIRQWVKMLKRKTIGSLLMAFGVLYLLIGLSIYFNSILGVYFPGLGYFAVGLLAIFVGYLVANNK
jgi:hypothetical protein